MNEDQGRIKGTTRRTLVQGFSAATGLIAMPAIVRAQAPQVMKIGTPTLNDDQHEWMRIFAAAVESGSKGAIKAELYPASQLGSAPRMIEGAQLGTVQVVVQPPEFLSGVDSRYELLGAPGLFKDLGHAQRCLLSPAFNKEFLSVGDGKGLKGIGLFINAQMIINCRTKLESLADISNKKIRVLASAIQLEQVKRLKGTGIPMALGEVLPAVQQGTIDGVMGSLPVLTALRFYDAAKYILDTEHATISVVSVASKVWYDKLPRELQVVIDEAGQKASADIYSWAVDFNEKQRKVWTDNGGEIVKLSPAAHEELMKLM
ncbi:MAG: putative Trap dicarboxylate transporter, dctp subunit, partial [Hyphomicrobiales bacterium]|nr:putative Trap dicarboxylate transporter, dctp subunit [Hyphomicrobiales bacterium]